ncbi:MAG: S-layer homology domain-containing protein [Lawsonibacter sp.]|nr:S-layer homology domain-containing protein [Lawsonibacter sp.]
MRNLKRALSLTLASVMLLGMMIVGTSAVSFNDADEISNVTAATVLQELEIMVGDGENFMPDQIVTRGQMAIIVCKILYGDRLNVSQFADSTQYTDVPANSYFNGYVNLATSLGIISGYGNGQFGPGDPVTTAQAALMLTKALGYFQGKELTGDWATDSMTAITQATKLGLFGKLNLDNNDGLSRDNVAELTFNTITKAVPVMYNSIWGVYYTDSDNVLGGTKFNYLDTLAFTKFDLVYKQGDDNFGRPTTKWGIGSVSGNSAIDASGHLLDSQVTIKDTFTEVADEATYTFTSKVTAKKLADTVGRSTARGYDWTVNGTDADIVDWTEDDNAIGESGNGVLTQVFVKTEDGETQARLFTIPYYVAKVDGSYNTSKKELRIASLVDDGAVDLPAKTETTLSTDDFDNLASFEDGDYVLVTVYNKEVQSIEKADVITGDVEGFVSKKNVTVDGEEYKYTKGYRADVDGGYKLDTEYNVVLDKFGYVIFADGVEGSDDYIYVNKSGSLGGASKSVEVEGVFPDGRKETVTLHNDTKGNLSINDTNWANGTVTEGWYKYDMKGGKYLLSNIDVGDKVSGTVSNVATQITENGKSTVRYSDTAGQSVPANSGTTFIVMKGSAVTTYDGVRNVPDIKAKEADAGITVAVIKNDKGYADYVLIKGDKDKLSSSGSAAGEYIFIVDADRVRNRKHSNGEDTVYEYEAVVNGEEKSILSTSNSWEVGLYTDVAYDGSYVDDMTKVRGAGDDDFQAFNLGQGANLSFDKAVLSWGTDSITLAEGCKVWTTDGDNLDTSSGTGLASDYKTDKLKGEIYLVISNNQATEVYVYTETVPVDLPGIGVVPDPETIPTPSGENWSQEVSFDGTDVKVKTPITIPESGNVLGMSKEQWGLKNADGTDAEKAVLLGLNNPGNCTSVRSRYAGKSAGWNEYTLTVNDGYALLVGVTPGQTVEVEVQWKVDGSSTWSDSIVYTITCDPSPAA